MKFIDEHRDRFGGVEPICRVLCEHGMQIAPSGYWAAKARPASARQQRDARGDRSKSAILAITRGHSPD